MSVSKSPPPVPGTQRPAPPTELSALRAEATRCQACPLWRHATQTVFGEGNPEARCMLIGEQPGQAEDHAGRPFVGPAGKLLDRALADAGLDRQSLYVTNVVKHFKWEARGQRRLHKTPAQMEIDACRRWLEGEVASIAPALLICLGATATRALLGGRLSLTALRGQIIAREGGAPVLPTVHPSYILRVSPADRAPAYRSMVDDLRVATSFLNGN